MGRRAEIKKAPVSTMMMKLKNSLKQILTKTKSYIKCKTSDIQWNTIENENPITTYNDP